MTEIVVPAASLTADSERQGVVGDVRFERRVETAVQLAGLVMDVERIRNPVRRSMQGVAEALAEHHAAEAVELGAALETVLGVVEHVRSSHVRQTNPHAEIGIEPDPLGEIGVGRGIGRVDAEEVIPSRFTGTVGLVLIAEGMRDVHETFGAEPEARVHGVAEDFAVAFFGDASERGHIRALVVVFQNDVDDAGDGVRPVLGGGSVAQNLDTLDCSGRDALQVDADLTFARCVVDVDQRTGVLALSVDEDERPTRSKASQVGRIEMCGCVRHGLLGRVERGHGVSEHFVECELPRGEELIGIHVVDGHWRGDHRSGSEAGSDDEQLIGGWCFPGHGVLGPTRPQTE